MARLPRVWIAPTGRLHPHVSYGGGVCVSDNLGISLDPSRRADIIAYTLVKAFDLLEKWDADITAGVSEFYNELEGYWYTLPSSTHTSGAIETDGQNRMITSYVKVKNNKNKWFFTERDKAPPRSFDVNGLTSQHALYLHLEEPVVPPIYPANLDAHFVAAIRQLLSAEQLVLWTKLLRPSSNKNHPRRVIVLISTPRAAGGVSLIGIEFGTRRGDVDLAGTVVPLTVRRHTASYMRERGGASSVLFRKHIAIVGCGAIGSVVADNLAAAGVGRLTLVDHDDFSEDNVFRHILDPLWVDFPKVAGLKYDLETHYPGIKVTPRPIVAQDWYQDEDFEHIDAVVFALGMPTLERSFNQQLRKLNKNIPLVFAWLEPLDLGGHSVLVWTHSDGCLDCLYRDDEGVSSLQSRTSFLAPDQAVSKNLTGCASVFVPYGALQSRQTGLIAASHVLSALDGGCTRSYRYWAGDGRAAHEQNLETTPWWREAQTVMPSESQSQRAFGRACKRCRVTK